jgi:hypothetical protein
MEEVQIPKGPWVHDQYRAYLKNFCLNCKIHTSMKLYAQNGKIYIYIYGRSLNDRHAGIYLLTGPYSSPEWKQVLTGRPESTPILSPDGCRFSFLLNGKLIVYDACAEDSNLMLSHSVTLDWRTVKMTIQILLGMLD